VDKLGSLATLRQRKREENTEAAGKCFNDTIQWVGCNSTPEHSDLSITPDYPILIKEKEIAEKTPENLAQTQKSRKQKVLNSATQELKQLLKTYKNNGIQTFLQGLTPPNTHYGR
jgi:hypothetical protein